MRFYIDTFNDYKEKGLSALRKGNLTEARFNLLKAAEYLFLLAEKSEGELRTVRKQTARKLLEMAKQIQPGKPKVYHTKESQGSSNDESRDEGAKKWILVRKPDIYFKDIAGLENVKELIKKRVIYPFQHPEITKRYKKKMGGGVLLYGPPGTGKTMIAKAVATELDAVFFNIKCSDIISKWVGDAEKNLADLFSEASQYERAVIFLDETESIVSKRGSGSTVMDRVIPEFLSQVDGIEKRSNCILLLGATNRPWDMDEAALRTGRFGELIYVGLPDIKARKKILELELFGVPMDHDIDYDMLAEKLEGYTGADIAGICETATDFPYDRERETNEKSQLTEIDLLSAIKLKKPSVTQNQLKKYEIFRSER
ncbi:MAG: hypothetical protein A2161_19065 [Candidatus Schekmanbacteria bacterium RBG_13_48_7]|uniref:AAA+ ATPase domain-containing protein n=1 Tax=Candidatus Schekmanbacteria bacterium RBG_13_48_7 TaxID=1817878 RepID=A0A1F7RQV8_9BACT|nr:MAG: hypothetical protein A2161_19065 [Candidatus Schekmanbacteria bacterium RBG_13_48_7]